MIRNELKKNSLWNQNLLRFEESSIKDSSFYNTSERIAILLQASSYLKKTIFEGASPSEGIAYLKNLLKKIREEADEPAKKSGLFDLVEWAYEDMMACWKAFNKNEDTVFLKELQEIIVKALERSKVCYLPIQWQEIKDGHIVILKIRIAENDRLAISFLNRGGGIEFHPSIKSEELKTRVDYQSFEVWVSRSSFFGNLGNTFLLKLRNLGAVLEGAAPHSATEVYGYLRILGVCLTEQGDPKRAVTPQRSGSCSLSSTALVLRDVLYTSGVEKIIYKRLMFGIKYLSLLSDFIFFENSKKKSETRRDILLIGAKELLTRSKKHQNSKISEEEYTKCLALVKDIYQIPVKKQTRLAAPQLHLPLGKLLIYSLTRGTKLETLPPSLRKIKSLDTASEIAEGIESLSLSLEKRAATPSDFLNLWHLFSLFPANPDPFWSSFKQANISSLISALSHVLLKMAAPQFGETFEAAQIELFHKGYYLAAYLATRVPEAKLNKHSFYYNRNQIDAVHFYDKETLDTIELGQKLENARLTPYDTSFKLNNSPKDCSMYGYLSQFLPANIEPIRNDPLMKEVKNDDLIRFYIIWKLLENKGRFESNGLSITIPFFNELTQLFGLSFDCVQKGVKPRKKGEGIYYAYSLPNEDRWPDWLTIKDKLKYNKEGVVLDLEIGLYRHYGKPSDGSSTFHPLYHQQVGAEPFSKEVCENASYSSRVCKGEQENALFHDRFTTDSHSWLALKTTSLSLSIVRELLTIKFDTQFRLIRASLWAKNHLFLLGNSPELRTKLEDLLFEPSSLRSARNYSHPQDLQTAIFEFLNQGLTAFKSHSKKHELYPWIAFLAGSLTKHFPELKLEPIVEQLTPYLEENLNTHSPHRHQAALGLAYLVYPRLPSRHHKDILEFARYVLVIKNVSYMTAKSFPLYALFEKLQEQLCSSILSLDKTGMNSFGQKLFTLLFPYKCEQIPNQWRFIDKYLKSDIYTIDPLSSVIYQSAQRVAVIDGILSKGDEWKLFKKIFRGWDAFPACIAGEIFIHVDKSCALAMSGNAPTTIWIRYDERWWTYAAIKLPDAFQSFEDILCWADEAGSILITDAQRDPIYIYNRSGKGIKCLKENDLYLLNPSERPGNKDLEGYLNQIEASSRIFFKGSREGGLKRIEMPNLGLQFEVQEGSLVSVEFPGMVWNSTTPIPLLNEFPGAIYLTNDVSEKILIPVRQFDSSSNSTLFSKQPTISSQNPLINAERPCFVYERDPKKNVLIGDCVEAQLYLTLIYRGQKDFTKALSTLKNTATHKRPSKLILEILSEITGKKKPNGSSAPKQRDYSPDALAFDCHLACHFLEQIELEPELGPLSYAPAALEKFAEDSFHAYCLAKSSTRKGVYAFSDTLVLSSFQEKRLKKVCSSDHDQTTCTFNWITLRGQQLSKNFFNYRKSSPFSDGETRPSYSQEVFEAITAMLKTSDVDEHRRALMHLYSFVIGYPNMTSSTNEFISGCFKNSQWKDTVKITDLFGKKVEGSDSPLDPPPSICVPGFTLSIPPLSKEAFGALMHIEEAKAYFLEERLPLVHLKELPLEDAPDPIEQRIINELREGHRKNLREEELRYKLQSTSTLSQIRSALKKSFEKLQEKIASLEKEIQFGLLESKETTDLNEIEFLRLNWQEGKILKPDISDLIEVVLSRKADSLLRKNPHLNREMIEALIVKFLEYTSLCAELSQVQQILDEDIGTKNEIDEFSVSQIGAKLAEKRHYDVQAYPEFLIFEWASGMLLRKAQAEKLIEIFKFEREQDIQHLLVEFEAGGGKTKVMLLLMTLVFSYRDRLVAIEIPSALYEIATQDIPKSLGKIFNQKCVALNLSIQTLLDTHILKNILNLLETCKREKKVLLIQPQTLDSLEMLIETPTPSEVYNAAFEIKKFFNNEKAIIISDEGHINASPLTETIKALDKLGEIPADLRKLMIKLYSHLYKLAEKELNEGSLSKMEAKTQGALKKQFIKQIIEDREFSGCEKSALKLYLNSEKKERPLWLKKLRDDRNTQRLAEKVILAKTMCATLLPHFFSLRSIIDFGPSVHRNDLTANPKDDKKDLLSKFADCFKTLALTVQEVYRLGVTPFQMGLLIKYLRAKIEDDHMRNLSTQEHLVIWIELFGPNCPVDSVDCSDEQSLAKFTGLFGKKPAVMEYYLDVLALPQVKRTLERIRISPADRSSWGDKVIFLSATPGFQELYPIAKQQTLLDPAFAAHTLDVLLRQENEVIISINQNDIEDSDFFIHLEKKLKTLPCALIDRGGLFCRTSIGGLAKRALASKYYTGVLYFNAEDQLVYLTGKDEEPHILEGTDIIQALRKKKITWSEEKILTIYTIDKTTGVDLKQPHTGVGMISLSGVMGESGPVGEPLTLDQWVQAVNRLRLLRKNGGQRIVILADDRIKETSLKKIISGMIKTTASKMREALEVRAIQCIWCLMKRTALREIGKKFNKSEAFQRRKHGFIDTLPSLLWDLYEKEVTKEETKFVLMKVALSAYQAFGYEDKRFDALSQADKSLLLALIDQSEKLIPEMSGSMNRDYGLNQTIVMNQDQEQLAEIKINENIQQKQQEARSIWKINTEKGLEEEMPFLLSEFECFANEYGWLEKCPPLFFRPSYFEIGTYPLLKTNSILSSSLKQNLQNKSTKKEKGDERIRKNLIKPIRLIHVSIKSEQIRFEALSIHCSNLKYIDDLKHVSSESTSNYARSEKNPSSLASASMSKFFIMNEKGEIVSRGTSSLEQIDKIKKSQTCQEILIFAALLRGEIPSFESVLKFLEAKKINYEEFQKLKNFIVSMGLSIDEKGFERILKLLMEESSCNLEQPQTASLEVSNQQMLIESESSVEWVTNQEVHLAFESLRKNCKTEPLLCRMLEKDISLNYSPTPRGNTSTPPNPLNNNTSPPTNRATPPLAIEGSNQNDTINHEGEEDGFTLSNPLNNNASLLTNSSTPSNPLNNNTSPPTNRATPPLAIEGSNQNDTINHEGEEDGFTLSNPLNNNTSLPTNKATPPHDTINLEGEEDGFTPPNPLNNNASLLTNSSTPSNSLNNNTSPPTNRATPPYDTINLEGEEDGFTPPNPLNNNASLLTNSSTPSNPLNSNASPPTTNRATPPHDTINLEGEEDDVAPQGLTCCQIITRIVLIVIGLIASTAAIVGIFSTIGLHAPGAAKFMIRLANSLPVNFSAYILTAAGPAYLFGLGIYVFIQRRRQAIPIRV